VLQSAQQNGKTVVPQASEETMKELRSAVVSLKECRGKWSELMYCGLQHHRRFPDLMHMQ